jgi:DNA-binding transcriptional LysR family regulator
LNLNHIKSYLALLQTGNYHKAAVRQGLAQSTISQHIRKLEKALNTTLIIRNRNGCTMAPRTEAFARYAAALNRLADRAWQTLRNPTLTVGASTNIGTYLLQPMFKDFYDMNGESLNLELVIDRNDRIANLLERDEVDLAVMEWWDNRSGFVSQPWKMESLVVIAPPDHPWGKRDSIQAEELLEENMIGGESASGTGRLLRETFGDLVSKFQNQFSLGNTEAVKKAVRAGLGISIVLHSSVKEEILNGTLKAVRINGTCIEKKLMAIHRRGLPANSSIAKFVEKLRTENMVPTLTNWQNGQPRQ